MKSLGGFLTGLIIPHDNGFAISFVEKLEDLISLLFLPLVSHFGYIHYGSDMLDSILSFRD